MVPEPEFYFYCTFYIHQGGGPRCPSPNFISTRRGRAKVPEPGILFEHEREGYGLTVTKLF